MIYLLLMTLQSDEYQTLASNSQGFFKDRGSKFFAHAFPVSQEEEIKEILKDLRKEFHDARHHCYAYRLGAGKLIYRANDDGEPSSSAGKPILGQILSYDLTDILIVVIRYFGGTLLGVPGLINAYRSAAKDAIENGEIIIKTVNDILLVRFDYLEMNNVMRIIKEEQPKMIHQAYDLECLIHLEVRRSHTSRLVKKLKKIDKAEVKVIETKALDNCE